MRHLRCGVILQGGVICHHAAKQRHIHRGSRSQSLLVFFFVGAACHSQRCQRFCLRSAHKEQSLGALVVALDSRIFQRFLCQLVCIQFRVQRKDLLLHQLCRLFGALAHIQRGIFCKVFAHGVLPRLRRNSGPEHAAVHGRFGAAGVVPVDAAGRDGLQNVKINIQALFHDQFSFSSSSDDAFFVSRYRSWPHRRRTLAGICVYRGSVHCNSYRSTASCG